MLKGGGGGWRRVLEFSKMGEVPKMGGLFLKWGVGLNPFMNYVKTLKFLSIDYIVNKNFKDFDGLYVCYIRSSPYNLKRFLRVSLILYTSKSDYSKNKLQKKGQLVAKDESLAPVEPHPYPTAYPGYVFDELCDLIKWEYFVP